MSHALIVEDDADAARMMASLVAAQRFTVATAGSLRDARRQLSLQRPDVILLDLQLPDGSGLDLYSTPELVAHSEVVLITGHASLETSVQALRFGAADYLTKPVGQRQLNSVLSRAMRPDALQAEIGQLEDQLAERGNFGHLWGRSQAMQRIYQQIARVAVTSISVFITGESGTGKEVVARSVHDLSRRRNRPFLGINCGAISPTLIESEIFGHEKGSFTGADSQHLGFFERAHGGTLFLDEITEMPLELQVKLLRVLETGTFMRVGSSQVREADVRIIAATNRSPEQAVLEHRLRGDLLYRLNVFPIDLPPLRQRSDDVALLARHFLAGVCQREGAVKHFTAQALQRLAAYRWPGNVRELRNVVQRSYVMADGEEITHEWLPTDAGAPVELAALTGLPALFHTGGGGHAGAVPGAFTAEASPPLGEWAPGTGVCAPASPAAASDAWPPAVQSIRDTPGATSATSASLTVALGSSLAEVERQLILATFNHFNQHKERTAAALGVSMKTLYNRLKDYGRSLPEGGETAEPHSLR